MGLSNKISHSRLLYADFISDENEEKRIVSKIKNFGFTASTEKDGFPIKFRADDSSNFIARLRSACKSDPGLFDYIDNVFCWIYRDGILPLKVVIVEVILKTDDLQKMQKPEMESKVWNISHLLGNCFSLGGISTPPANSSADFRILGFSYKAIPNVMLRNFAAEFVVEADRKFFDDFNSGLDMLEKGMSVRDLKEHIEKIRTDLISLEPVSFYGGRFSYDQTIVRGYANEIFIIGKIVQGSLADSPSLYLSFITMGEIPRINLENMPVLQLPGVPGLLDFSFGAGQLLMLQLLNSWNRHVENLVAEITTKQSADKTKMKTDVEETLEELRQLIFHTAIDEKIMVNYRRKLEDLADPSRKTFHRELSLPPEEGTPYSQNPERFGLEKPGPIVSNLASLILNNLDLNEKHILDAISVRKSKMDVLKIEEDRRNSTKMLHLTYVIAVATIVNIVLFVLWRMI